MSLPKNTDISVVVQGPVSAFTREVLLSVRRVLPGAELILSTWEGTDTAGLDFDRRVLSADPGGVVSNDSLTTPVYNNIRRQLVSTWAGLKEASRPYILKLRTDTELLDRAFLNEWDAYPARDPKYSLFNHRILDYYLFAKDRSLTHGRYLPVLFHPSDWMFFGLAEDVRTLFDCSLPSLEEAGRYWKIHTKNKKQFDPFVGYMSRYAPEQVLGLNVAKKLFADLRFEHYLDVTREKEFISHKILANNFHILDYRFWRIRMPKYQEQIGSYPAEIIWWAGLYKKYADSSFHISWREYAFALWHWDWRMRWRALYIDIFQQKIKNALGPVYRAYLRKKYADNPEKLKLKLSLMQSTENCYTYAEDSSPASAAPEIGRDSPKEV